MTIIQLDTSIKNDEGVVHQFMKKSLWYNITKRKYGNVFWKKSEKFNFDNRLKLENKKAYLELEIKLDNKTIIPDISVFDDKGNIETVIECIDTSRPSLTKYECYINSNINVIFVNTESKISGFGGGYVDCDLIILKENPERYRFLTLLKHLAKLTRDWTEGFKYIGKFQNDDTYFLFGKSREHGIRFFTSTMYTNGNFSKANSKKIPVLLKQYVEKYKKEDLVQTLDYRGQIYVPREEFMMGIRKYDERIINYWSL
jgi:hypothetical protein